MDKHILLRFIQFKMSVRKGGSSAARCRQTGRIVAIKKPALQRYTLTLCHVCSLPSLAACTGDSPAICTTAKEGSVRLRRARRQRCCRPKVVCFSWRLQAMVRAAIQRIYDVYYVCIYTHTHMHICLYICISTTTYSHCTHILTYVYSCIHTHTHIHTHIHPYHAYIHAYIHVCIYAYIHTYLRTYPCTGHQADKSPSPEFCTPKVEVKS